LLDVVLGRPSGRSSPYHRVTLMANLARRGLLRG